MGSRIQRLRRDERGMTFIVVGAGFTAFLAATSLAIDVGMFMTARSQAQNAADAGALSGAIALVFNDFDDRSAGGPAVTSAMNAALANTVIHANVSVTPADVTFPVGPTGESNRVRVTVYRTRARGNAVPTMIGAIFGVLSADIMAAATAEASPADAETCVLPFTIPDRWQENSVAGGWTPDSEFNLFDRRGDPIADPDVYVAGPDGTGYDADRDKGIQLVLKNNNENQTAPSFYNPWDLPGSTGGDDYRDNIATCNTNIVRMGDPMNAEPGNMVGPTRQGTNDLVARDPNARWDFGCNCVMDSAFSISPRIGVVPLYDPVIYETGKQNGNNASLEVSNFLGFFIEGMDGNQVVGRITPITGIIAGGGGPSTPGAFPMAIRLVQ